MVGVYGTQGYGVRVRALGLRLSDGRAHLRDGAGDGGFLGRSVSMPIENQPKTEREDRNYFERGHG